MRSEGREQIPGSGSCFSLVVLCGKFASTNQIHDGVLGNVASSVWTFSAHFPDAISRGNQWWRRKMSAVFSGFVLDNGQSLNSDIRKTKLRRRKKKKHLSSHSCYTWSDYSHASLALLSMRRNRNYPSLNTTWVHRWLKTWKETRCRIKVLFWDVILIETMLKHVHEKLNLFTVKTNLLVLSLASLYTRILDELAFSSHN